MIDIDGGYGEGGGAIIRTALALSTITRKSFSMINIRKGREETGLKEQHYQTVKAIKKLCNAEVKGLELGSNKIDFIPKKITKNRLKIDIRTAGSTALLLQSLLIASLKNRLKIEINGGGSFNLHAPSTLYLEHVLKPMLEKFGYIFNITTQKHGFFPKGGAKILAVIKPADKLDELNLIGRGKLIEINGISIASDFLEKAKVADRQADIAASILEEYNCRKIKREYVSSLNAGSGILVYAKFENSILGYDVVGEKGKRSEEIGKEAANGLIKQIKSDACVDEFMSDQLIPYMGLSGEGKIRVSELTNHAKTNIWLVEKFLDVKFKVEDNVISCKRL